MTNEFYDSNMKFNDEILFNGLLIRLIDVPPDEINNRNLIAIDNTGKIIWTIEDLSIDGHDSPFVGIERVAGRLIAYNWDGLRVEIDPESGKICSRKITK